MNPAPAIVRAGFVCGAAFIVASAIRGCVHGVDWKADLLWTAVFGGSAIVLLVAAGSLGVRVLLRSRLPGEIARGNLAAGERWLQTGPAPRGREPEALREWAEWVSRMP